MRHDNHGHDQPDNLNVINDRGYDTRDVSFVSVLKALFFLFVFVGASSAITLVIYNVMVPRGELRTSAFPPPRVQALPPDPRLQANPVLDIKTFREQEAAALTTYGRDPKTGEIHIPVDRAIDLVAAEGLPTRANAGQPNPQEPNEPSYTEGAAASQGSAAQPAAAPGAATSSPPASSNGTSQPAPSNQPEQGSGPDRSAPAQTQPGQSAPTTTQPVPGGNATGGSVPTTPDHGVPAGGTLH